MCLVIVMYKCICTVCKSAGFIHAENHVDFGRNGFHCTYNTHRLGIWYCINNTNVRFMAICIWICLMNRNVVNNAENAISYSKKHVPLPIIYIIHFI